MRKHTIAKLVLLLFAITLVSTYAFGIVEKLSIEELTKQANLIVMGTVVSTESQWEYVSGGGQRIFTYVYIDVEKYIKGLGGELIDLKVPGGTVDEITEWVSDTPQFTEGERVIVFLRYEFFQVVGWNQGKFTIKDDKVAGLEVPVDEFITMIQKIDEESLLGLRDVLPTDIKQAEIQLESEETPDIGEPISVVFDISMLEPTDIKDESKKEISDKPVSIEGMPIPAPGWINIMTEGFEGVFPSGLWQVSGNPTWDEDDYKPHTGSWSAWCANGGTLGRDPEFNNYPNYMYAWMIYGPFDLSDATDAEVLFYYWNISQPGYDYFSWYASPNGTNWYGYGTGGDSGGWKYVNFDLTDVYSIGNLCGDDSVWIAFVFDSDYMYTYKGAFVDDIILRKTGLPNLTPYKPSGWADKIVISNHPGDHDDDSPLYTTDTLYIDWAVLNNGADATEAGFYTRLYVDGIVKQTWETSPPLDPGWYAYAEDYSIGSLSAGNHTIKIVADYDNRIAESNETDNEYQRTINIIEAPNPPYISSITPSKASAGTETSVTVTGTDFGATQGSSKVEFFYKSGQPKISAPIVSWSDTQIVCKVPTDMVGGYPASSSSGPVTVTTDAGTSNGYTFKVTFGYGGVEWLGSHPWVDYEINENTEDCTGEGAAVIAAANEWNNKCAKFAFIYDGATSATDYSYNEHNEIFWGITGGSIATTVYWYSGTTILECDIVFNDDFTWCTDGSAGKYDVQNIAAHELGHWLNLRDLYGDIGDGEYDTAKTMYGYGATGETKKQSLHEDDAAGILWIYGTGGDTWDPTDDTGSGGTILTPSDTEQSHGRHSLTSCDQYDWYQIDMTAGNTYYFRSTCDFPAQSGGHGDTYGELFSDSGGTDKVAEDDDSGGNWQFSFSYTPTTDGTYYLRVTTYGFVSFWSGYIHYEVCEPQIAVTSPNGGEVWQRGTNHDITWSTSCLTGNVKLELYKAGSLDSEIAASVAIDGSPYSWAIPSVQTRGIDYRVRITSLADGSIWDESNGDFTITAPQITVTSPDGGETWQRGTNHDITWSYQDLTGNIKLELYKAGSLDSEIAASVAIDSSPYSWAIPSVQTGGIDYRVRITSLADGSIWDESDGDFTIIAPQLKVDPTSLEFGYFDIAKTFTIDNVGDGILVWSITDDAGWLTISPISGDTTAEVDTINASVDRVGLTPGPYNATISITSNGGDQDIPVSMMVSIFDIISAHGKGGKSWVKLFEPDCTPILSFKAFGSVNTLGEVHIVGGDVDVDTHDEIAAGQGEGGKSWVKFFEVDGSLISTFKAFGAANTNGELHLAIGNFDAEPSDNEIAVAQGEGGQSWIKVFEADGTLIRSFKAFGAANSQGEVHLAAGDLENADGIDEIVAGMGEGGSSRVKIFSYDGSVIRSFPAFDATDNPGGEVRLAVGNFDADADLEIAAATGYNGKNKVRLFDKDGTLIKQFLAFGSGGNPNGDVQIAAADIDDNGIDEILCGHGEGGDSWVKVFKADGTSIFSFKAFGGVNAQGEVHLTRCKY